MDTDAYNYDYDPIGNRNSASSTVSSVSSMVGYLANELNQYTNISTGAVEEPTYDSDGNMLTYGTWTFTWNGENRLLTATDGSTTYERHPDGQDSCREPRVIPSLCRILLSFIDLHGRQIPRKSVQGTGVARRR